MKESPIEINSFDSLSNSNDFNTDEGEEDDYNDKMLSKDNMSLEDLESFDDKTSEISAHEKYVKDVKLNA